MRKRKTETMTRALITVCVCTHAWLCVCVCASGAAQERCDVHAPAECHGVSSVTLDYACECHVTVLGQKTSKFRIDLNSEKVNMVCGDASTLDAPLLPRFKSGISVQSVALSGCAPPARRSLAAALAAVNIRLLDTGATSLALTDLPPTPPLADPHFSGLEHVRNVTLAARLQTRLAPGSLAVLRNLRALRTENVRLSPEMLERLPLSLSELELKNADVERLSAAVLTLPDLRRLTLADGEGVFTEVAIEVTEAAKLRFLALDAPNTRLPNASILPPVLERLYLRQWSEPLPGALVRCGALRSLRLEAPAARALPARWVAACPALEEIALLAAKQLKRLPFDLLANATSLTEFTLLDGALKSLPKGMFNDAHRLKALNLRNNYLKMLPSGIFASVGALQSLDLSQNMLYDTSLPTLQPLRELRMLDLGRNKLVMRLCSRDNGTSILSSMTRLELLVLNYTRVMTLCSDWRERMPRLRLLDLAHTNITQLQFADFQYVRTVPSVVNLYGAPISRVVFGSEDFKKLRRSRELVEIKIDSQLQCDCSMYWTWRTFKYRYTSISFFTSLRCKTGGQTSFKERNLIDLSEEELECELAEAWCPERCACSERPMREGVRVLRLVRVRCERGGWSRVPPLPRLDAPRASYDLLLAHNRISRLPRDHLPARFRELDLRNNSLQNFDAQTVTELVSGWRRLYISGNPLACDCNAASTLSVLRNRSSAVADYMNATCANGEPLFRASTEPCGPLVPAPVAVALVAALVALLMTGVAVAACLAQRGRRQLVKAVFDRMGLWPRRPTEPVDDRRYDAFISFSHEDERFVLELVQRLESASPPYRLCLHYRDWVPGRRIPEQIAESVRRSRRTVAVVSRDFLRSTWARAEFREAYAHALREATPRLVVVLLEEPERLPLDAELRRYLALNTYVRRGDPWFWRKLRLALPTPRAFPHHTDTQTPSHRFPAITMESAL